MNEPLANRRSPESSPDGSTSPLRMRRRPDVEVYPLRRRHRRVWVVKDPVAFRFFQFRPEEYAIFQWLDGRTGLDQIRRRFEERFAPRRISPAQLHTFIGSLHQAGLVLSDYPGQGDPLLQRARRQRRSEAVAMLANPLAIRFRGFDPQRWLDRWYPTFRPLFSRWSGAAALALICVTVLVLFSDPATFRSRLPAVESIIAPSNLVWLAAATALTKLVHECAHAMTCRHFGGECHEMGLMLLVFTPCLYCDVTDAWKMPARSSRIAIGAAGIVVEVVMAATFGLLWWFSNPGLLSSISFNVMLVCSIGTVLLNGNPLLRYDGYYILSDALDLPNLWQDSRRLLRHAMMRFFFGADGARPVANDGRPGLLIVYAIASMTYRLFVVVSILYLVYQICKPLGLLFVAQLVAAVVLLSSLAPAATFLFQLMSNPILRRRLMPGRVAATCLAATAAILMVFSVPLPCSIEAPAVIEPADARRVYVSVPGLLREAVTPGTLVHQDQMIARLENLELSRQLERARGQWKRQSTRLESLRSLRNRSESVAAQLPAAKEILDDLAERVAQLQQDVDALQLIAPRSGRVLPPPSRRPTPEDAVTLAGWSGTPMDPPNRGAHLERRTLFCLVSPDDTFEAAVYVNQADIALLATDQPIELLADVSAGRVLEGVVAEISQVNSDDVPDELAFDGRVATRIDADGQRRFSETVYRVRVRLNASEAPLLAGARAKAKIHVPWQPLATQISRFLSRTFRPVI